MIRHRLVTFAAGIGLALSALAGTALAHTGLDSPAAAASTPLFPDQVPQSAPAPATAPYPPVAPRDHGLPLSALVVAGFALLAALPNRRRTLALALTLLLATVTFEAVAHAALHLGHLGHADGLVIDASAVPPAVLDVDTAPLRSSPLAPRGVAPEWADAGLSDGAPLSARERAPPTSADS